MFRCSNSASGLKIAGVIRTSILLIVLPVALWAAANGSLSGTLMDPSGAVVEGATITLVNVAPATLT
jgi:hypothetical protein